MPTSPKVRVELLLSPQHIALLDAAARERDCSRADVIRDLIRSLAPKAVRS